MSTNEMSKRSIDRLLRAISQGDSSAFEKLYMQTKNGIYAFLYSYLRNRADTEDCLHDVFLKIHRYAEKYRENTNGRAWILQIAKNTALDLIRKRKTSIHEELHENIAATETQLPYLFGAMQKILQEEEQRIIILHVLWGYKHREIAQSLDLPTGTVTAKYKRAIDKLKKYIKEDEQ